MHGEMGRGLMLLSMKYCLFVCVFFCVFFYWGRGRSFFGDQDNMPNIRN